MLTIRQGTNSRRDCKDLRWQGRPSGHCRCQGGGGPRQYTNWQRGRERCIHATSHRAQAICLTLAFTFVFLLCDSRLLKRSRGSGMKISIPRLRRYAAFRYEIGPGNSPASVHHCLKFALALLCSFATLGRAFPQGLPACCFPSGLLPP